MPAIWLIAASIVAAVRSGILRSAISRTWALVMLATFSLLGTPEPFSTPAALENQQGGRGRLRDEGEAAVCIYRDNDRNLEADLVLGTFVEFFDKLRDIDTVLAQSRAYRALPLPLPPGSGV